MLKKLYIKDYAIIDEIEVEFSEGLNILTGETGTGKSIIIGAFGILLGEACSTDFIRKGAKKRKTVRGNEVTFDMTLINLKVVKYGEATLFKQEKE